MKKKLVLLVLLISVSFVFAGQFTAELSLAGGLQNTRSDNDLYTDALAGLDAPEYFTYSNITLKSDFTCYYNTTGIYISAEKPFGVRLFKRYIILSGGVKQRVQLAEKLAFDVYCGTTWHSVDAAIQSIIMFQVDPRILSRPGLDTGVDLIYGLSDDLSLVLGFNYNYNKHEIQCPPTGLNNIDVFYFRNMTINAGISYTLF